MRKLLIILGLVLLLQLIWVATTQAAPPPSGGFWHRVHHGETLFSIGRHYGVNPYAICRANELYNCNYIYAGQKLWIPHRVSPRPIYYRRYPTPPRCIDYYVVPPGQTLYGISRLYDVPAWAIARANHISNWNYLHAGARLCIPHP